MTTGLEGFFLHQEKERELVASTKGKGGKKDQDSILYELSYENLRSSAKEGGDSFGLSASIFS